MMMPDANPDTWQNLPAILTALTALAAIATAVAAWVYTIYTKKLLDESRDPLVVVYTRPSSRGAPWLELVVRNIGHRPAYDVHFSTDFNLLQEWLSDSVQQITATLGVLPSDEVLVLDLTRLRYDGNIEDQVLEITATYRRMPSDKKKLEHKSIVSSRPALPVTIKTSANPLHLIESQLDQIHQELMLMNQLKLMNRNK